MDAMNSLFLEARAQALKGWTLHLQDLSEDERREALRSLPEWLVDGLRKKDLIPR